MICVDKLTLSYGDRAVLRDVSFTLAPGCLTALLGENGAGKTTLMRCMLGLHARCGGGVYLDGREVRTRGAPALARQIAYIPQSHDPAFNYTVLDMVMMGTTSQLSALASPGQRQRARAMDALERMGVAALSGRGYLRLSGGERQLVLIARALAQNAPILLMDEPTASLDYGNRLRVLAQVRALTRDGYTVLLSTHEPQHALSYADRVVALHRGEKLCDGAPDDVLDEALLETLYGVRARLIDTPQGRVLLPGERA